MQKYYVEKFYKIFLEKVIFVVVFLYYICYIIYIIYYVYIKGNENG